MPIHASERTSTEKVAPVLAALNEPVWLNPRAVTLRRSRLLKDARVTQKESGARRVCPKASPVAMAVLPRS